MENIYLIVGTRPEAIKMAPVFKALRAKKGLRVKLISTGQHRELLQQALAAFGLKADFDLDVMRPGQSLSSLTARLLVGLEDLFQKEKPDLILAHGDTTTCYATALSAFYHSVPLFHVEAGLRTGKLNSPYPEEFNRQCVTQMAAHHFAPTEVAKHHLMKEGIQQHAISIIGSTVHDAIRMIAEGDSQKLTLGNELDRKLAQFRKIVLLTLHRREASTSLERLVTALKEVAVSHPDVAFAFPVHPNPQIRGLASSVFSNLPNVLLLKPMAYPVFLSLLSQATLVCTDSGGVQEEASYFGKRTLILREMTERDDGIDQELTEVIGFEPANVFSRISQALLKPTPKMIPSSSSRSASQIVADIVAEKCFA